MPVEQLVAVLGGIRARDRELDLVAGKRIWRMLRLGIELDTRGRRLQAAGIGRDIPAPPASAPMGVKSLPSRAAWSAGTFANAAGTPKTSKTADANRKLFKAMFSILHQILLSANDGLN